MSCGCMPENYKFVKICPKLGQFLFAAICSNFFHKSEGLLLLQIDFGTNSVSLAAIEYF